MSRHFSLAALTLGILAFATPVSARPVQDPLTSLRNFSEGAGEPLRTIHGARGTSAYIGGILSGAMPSSTSPQTFALGFISTHRAALGISNLKDLVFSEEVLDQAGGHHIVFTQRHGGVPVYGATVVVHFSPDGFIQSVTNRWVPDLKSDTRDLLNEETMREVVADELGPDLIQLGPGELFVKATSAGSDIVAWRVPSWLVGETLPREARVLWIDAHTGIPLWGEDPKREGQTTGTGVNVLGEQMPLNMWQGKDFRLKVSPLLRPYVKDAKKGAYNLVDQTTTDLGWIYTFDANETYMLNTDYVYGDDNSFDGTDSGQKPGVAAHDYFRKTLDYYAQVWGRKGIDNAGLPVSSMVQISDPVETYPLEINAGWLGYGFNFMIFGTGGEWPIDSGIMWRPFSCCLDIIGHELNHGVNEFTVNLGYEHESGALNEHLADVFGVTTQAYYEGLDWLMAEKVFENPVYPYDAVRSFEDPKLYNQPDRMAIWRAEPLTYDAGGVHFNSGIGNKAFYLAVQGGTFNGVKVTPLDPNPDTALEIAQDVWYDIESSRRIGHDSQYLEMRQASLDAINSLYPTKLDTLKKAWDAVEVTDAAYPDPAVEKNEPNDYDELAIPLSVGASAQGYLWNRADSDWYAITGEGEVTIRISGFSNPAQATLYTNGLFNQMFDQASSNNPDILDEIIITTLERNTIYYLELLVDEDGVGSKTAPYTISVSANP